MQRGDRMKDSEWLKKFKKIVKEETTYLIERQKINLELRSLRKDKRELEVALSDGLVYK